MELTKDSPIVKNLFLKRGLLRAGDKEHEKIRPALLILGGCMRGVIGGGSLVALNAIDLARCFDVVVTVSTGSAIGAYGLAGLEQSRIGTSIYYEDCWEHEFISFRRWLLKRGPAVNIDFIEWMFREGGKDGKKKLDTDAIARGRPEFFVGITDYNSGQGVLVDAKRARPDMISALTASVSIPGLYSGWREVNCIRGVDGGMALQFPIKEVMENFNSTDVVVIANCSKKAAAKKSSLAETIARPFLFQNLPLVLQESARKRHEMFTDGVIFSEDVKNVNVGILWGSEDVKLLTRNPKKLRAAAVASVERTLEIFGHPEIEVNLL